MTNLTTLTRDPDTDTLTATIRRSDLGAVTTRLNELVDIAKSLDVTPITYTVSESFDVETTVGDFPYTTRITVSMVEVTVAGTTPRLPGGWAYLGTIEHLSSGNLVHGEDPVLGTFRDAEPTCDHCNLRRNRNKTIVLRDEDGNIARVGTSCLKDFLGYHGSPEHLINLATWISEFADDTDTERNSYGGRDYDVPTEHVLTLTAAVVRTHGWLSKSAAAYDNRTPTADIVGALLFGVHSSDKVMKALISETEAPNDDDAATVTDALAWLAENPETGDYIGNLKVVALSEWIDGRRHLGLVCSLIGTYLREMDRLVEAERLAEAGKDSEWIGKVGDMIDLTVEVTIVRTIEGHYGTSYLVAGFTPDGDKVKTFSSGRFGMDAEEGATYTIRGKIKDHDIYNDVKETVLNRVKEV